MISHDLSLSEIKGMAKEISAFLFWGERQVQINFFSPCVFSLENVTVMF
jgi:hypothetical protein